MKKMIAIGMISAMALSPVASFANTTKTTKTFQDYAQDNKQTIVLSVVVGVATVVTIIAKDAISYFKSGN